MKGTVWSSDQLPENLVVTKEMTQLVEEAKELILREHSKPVLITGGRGVGKSTIINMIAESMGKEGVQSRIVTGPNLKAGNKYIGMIEQVVEQLIDYLRRENELWIAPEFLQIYYAAKHDDDPMGVLDMIMPYLRRGEIQLLGEISEDDLEKLVTLMPEVQDLFEVFRIEPASKSGTLELARQWIEKDNKKGKWEKITDDQLEELFFISRQYLSYQENPGALLNFFKYTTTRFKNEVEPLEIESFYEALSSYTGLPVSILNDQEKLDLDELRTRFNSKVVGQEEAVNVLVERIAMIKAGLTDPSKPFGVFLFVGPTGTGKTEITKMLAEYLFSSPDRMIRLDMSEFQSAASPHKIFGAYGGHGTSSSLVNEIRKNPFSVILLDEFEKAHPRIWDLFLQVFDDGRLSDSQGSTVDFRQSIIIMTSNIGAAIPASKAVRRSMGFTSEPVQSPTDTYDPGDRITKAVNQTFRPEFVNRIDKIVVFNPLSRAALSTILDIELKKVLQRRGLRNKKWALDMEDSAIEFLLEKGYTRNLGARPLKRAIEQYLLAPLATAIVNHNFPKGDQFLLVSRGKHNNLKVRFIDPDEPEYTWEEKVKLQEHQEQKSKSLSLHSILRETYGSLAEFTYIKTVFEQLQQAYLDSGMRQQKEELMLEMADPQFWQSENRQETLSQIEFYDRFDAAFETSKKLLERLEDPDKVRLNYDPALLKKLAQKIYLLQIALASDQEKEPQDALLMISFEDQHAVWGDRIDKMYLQWARRRKMGAQKLHSGTDQGREYHLYHFSGFGAYAILKKEHGSHVKEKKSKESKMMEKSRVQVSVLPLDLPTYALIDQPAELLAKFREVKQGPVVRRFNMGNKQCKDVVNKWQTGNMEKVLKGGFDVMG
jgi:ATP-dependent Clp protease ATP-binding subunit ClpC